MARAWIGIILVSVLAVAIRAESAGCVETLSQDEQFKNCMDTYTMYMLRAQTRGDMTGPQILCNPEVTNLMGCLYDFIDKCPNIMGDSQLPSREQFELICESNGISTMGSGAQDPPQCRKLVSKCTGQSKGLEEEELESPTPFGNFPKQLKHICGSFKMSIDCLNQHKEKCPETVNVVLNAVNRAQPSENFSPKFQTLEVFMKQECPKIPKDIATNNCVSKNLNSQKFLTCVQAVFRTQAPNSCSGILAGRKCIETTIEKHCGRKYANVFYISTPIFIANVPDDCDLPAIVEDPAMPTTETNMVQSKMPVTEAKSTESNVEPAQNVQGETSNGSNKKNNGIVTSFWTGLIVFTSALSIGIINILF